MYPYLLHLLIESRARRCEDAVAVVCKSDRLSYGQLSDLQRRFACALVRAGTQRGDRVAVLLSKSFEFVASTFGAAYAGAAFVPVNPVLKPPQVGHILRDSGARVVVVSPERLGLLRGELACCPDLRHVVVVGAGGDPLPELEGCVVSRWDAFLAVAGGVDHGVMRTITDDDMVAIFYTSGSTGKPKGVILSHRSMVTGAASVASYLGNRDDDRILAVLPLAFDAGFSQLTTAFHAGARVVLLDYLLPHEVVRVVASERITGLTAVPPLYAQLAAIEWPAGGADQLRYFASTGGRMPREILGRIRARAPAAKPFLMYGLTEAFRSTFLPPDQVDLRPDSIGKAIPNQEILVLDAEGRQCPPEQPGELVHRGSTVAIGYWGDEALTWERFRPIESRVDGIIRTEIAVFSGDIVKRDAEGYLYFVGRRDDMIKSSGYRISPTEVEEAAYDSGLVVEVAAIGVEHPTLGQSVVLVAVPAEGSGCSEASLIAHCREHLLAYMVPSTVKLMTQPLPRNPNGKIDRRHLVESWQSIGSEVLS